jgi:predicted ester cyclase
MMQAGAWPMGPSLGREWQVPGPATQDGLGPHGRDALESGQAAARHVTGMLEHMARHPSQGGPEVMEMERFWHPRMNWYGPAGIGTARGIAGFRNWHQIPFLNAMPDRGQLQDGIDVHLFGEGDYVGVTGWPNMRQTLSHPGWLGLPPTGQQITLRSLDFWRLENGLIRENWVLVDLLDVYRPAWRRCAGPDARVQQGAGRVRPRHGAGAMRQPRSYAGLERLGRTRLSRHFFLRDFLYSEIGSFHGVPNIPEDPDLAIAAGRRLCADLLDPLTETFGPIHVRSAYRSPRLNHSWRHGGEAPALRPQPGQSRGPYLGPARRGRAHGGVCLHRGPVVCRSV